MTANGKRRFVHAMLAAVCLASAAAAAQTYPAKAIRVVVGFPPGGATDVVARALGQKMSEAFGQPVVIDNRAGAASNIASEHVAGAPKDGYTLLMGTISLAINATLYKKLAYDALKDLAPVTQVTSAPFLLVVHPSVPAHTVKAFIALARSRPGQLNYASAGNGSGAHLFAAMFGSMAGVDIVHVPYKGAAPATTAVLSGETPFMFDNIVIATYCGLTVDPETCVLNVYGEAIPRLYAAGELMGGFHGVAYMTGSSLGKCIIFGRIAGRMAAQAL